MLANIIKMSQYISVPNIFNLPRYTNNDFPNKIRSQRNIPVDDNVIISSTHASKGNNIIHYAIYASSI